MLFGIHANESSPCSLRINGILQGRGSFLGSECFTYCLAIYSRTSGQGRDSRGSDGGLLARAFARAGSIGDSSDGKKWTNIFLQAGLSHMFALFFPPSEQLRLNCTYLPENDEYT